MRAAAAAAACRLQLVHAAAPACAGPQAAHLFTSTAAASFWRSVLSAASAILPPGKPAGAHDSLRQAAAAQPAGAAAQQQQASASAAAAARSSQPPQAGSSAAALADGAAEEQAAARRPRRLRRKTLSDEGLKLAAELIGGSSSGGSSGSSGALQRIRREKQGAQAAEAGTAAAAGGDGLAEALHTQDDSSAAGEGSSSSGGGGSSGGGKSRSSRSRGRSRSKSGSAAAAAEAGADAGAGGSDGEGEGEAPGGEAAGAPGAGSCPLPPALILQDDAHPIRESDISRPAWFVLARLRAAGHEAYVVGGTVRDLLLGGTPKDYDLLTSAEPHQIRKIFSRCHVVGRSFPVCQVFVEGTMIEVSSFSTNADTALIPADASSHMIGRQGKGKPRGADSATWAAARADNALRRDFTVNALLYDPFGRLLFDSVGGVADCAARRLRTICPPADSFAADPARILRGVRLAARAGLEVDGPTAEAMEAQAAAIAALPQGRLQMEVGSLLGYGAAGASLALMWRLGLLDLLLPQHALFLSRHRVPRAPRSAVALRRQRGSLLFQLMAELDAHVHPQKPVDPCVWVALLAAPLVAERCAQLAKQPAAAAQGLPAASDGADLNSAAAAAAASASDDEDDQEEQECCGETEGEEGPGSDAEAGSGGGALVAAAAPRRYRAVGALGPEQQARLDYLDAYGQVVSDVLDGMLQSLDADTMGQLGRQARKHGAAMQRHKEGARGKRRGGALLPCVVCKAALDRAAALLLLEADLRGRPELRLLLDRSGWAPASTHAHSHSGGNASAAADAAAAAPNGQPLGRHNAQHQLWQQLERAARGGDSGGGGGAEQWDAPPHPQGSRKHRKGRVLSAEERLVLGILSDPRFDFAARTALPAMEPAAAAATD